MSSFKIKKNMMYNQIMLTLFSVLVSILSPTGLEAQIGRLPLSPVQKIEQKIGLTDITIVYSRPSARDRKIFGGLVSFDKLWRTGANRNTTIQFNQTILINGQRIRAGKYAVFSIPHPEKWEIIFYQDTDNWDVPEELDRSKIVAHIEVESVQMIKKREVFSIMIGDFTNYKFDLNISWENTLVSIPIELTTKELMDKKIKNHLEGPSYDDYYAAAEYQMESGKEFAKGLQWINQAISVTEKVTWWDLRIKAILLMELGRKTEAKTVAEDGLKMAETVKREYGIKEFKKILKQLD